MEEVRAIAGDVRAIGDIIESKETKILQALANGNEAKAEKLVNELTLTELQKLNDMAIMLFNVCRQAMRNK